MLIKLHERKHDIRDGDYWLGKISKFGSTVLMNNVTLYLVYLCDLGILLTLLFLDNLMYLPIWGEQTWPNVWRSDIFMSYEQSGIHCGNKLAAKQHLVILYDGDDGDSTSIYLKEKQSWI